MICKCMRSRLFFAYLSVDNNWRCRTGKYERQWVPVCAEGDELWRFIRIPNSVHARFNALSLGTSTFLIDAEHLLFSFFSFHILWFTLRIINRIILFVPLVIPPQNTLKVFCTIDLNVIPNISDSFPDSSWRVALQWRTLQWSIRRRETLKLL